MVVMWIFLVAQDNQPIFQLLRLRIKLRSGGNSVVRYLIPLDFDAQIEIMTDSESIFSKESENGR